MISSAGKAHAKVNLSLDIVSKMDDGYHGLETVMQSVELSDDIFLECFDDGGNCGVTVETNLDYIPNDERNIAARAVNSFFSHTGIGGFSAKLTIDKHIPVCAGLGGGSSDAACVLRMLDDVFKTGLGDSVLEKLAYTLGADVPFCIRGGTMLAEGRGEILTELTSLPMCHIVICKPPFSCSTPELFSLVDCRKIRTRPDTGGLIASVNAGNLKDAARRMYNVFEDVLPRGRPEIEEIKVALLDGGALGAVMTGSGPSVFGLFDDRQNATDAYDKLKETYRDCFLTVRK